MKKFLKSLDKRLVPLLLGIYVLIAVALHINKAYLPCLNADEAAFGYNAFSISETGRDEYGNLLPTRLKSFGDNKLPLMTYLTVPLVKVFGLNDFSTRAVAGLFGIISPLLFYFVTWQLTKNRNISLIAAFLSAVSIWIQVLSRHAHEALLAYGLVMIALVFFVKYLEKLRPKDLLIFSLLFMLSLFSYHLSKGLIIFFSVVFFVHLFIIRKSLKKLDFLKLSAIFLIPIFIFIATEFIYPASRVTNLLFIQDKGFVLTINELNGEHPSRLIHNKLTHGVTYLTQQYLSYFSPEFLVTKGSEDPRFGYKGMSPITVVEYIFIFVGFYYLYKNKQKYRFLILFMLLVSPLTASLAWQEHSLKRAFIEIVPIIFIVAYGAGCFFEEIWKNKYRWVITLGIISVFGFYLYMSWDFYFNHYFKRPLVVRAWQCGYKELSYYVKQNYDKFDRFYISKQHGMPYIYMLYYLGFDPNKYQTQANLSAPDQYGFGQVEKFDKFVFSTDMKPDEKSAVMIGYPDDFTARPYVFDSSRIRKISVGTEDIFWIYESAK